MCLMDFFFHVCQYFIYIFCKRTQSKKSLLMIIYFFIILFRFLRNFHLINNFSKIFLIVYTLKHYYLSNIMVCLDFSLLENINKFVFMIIHAKSVFIIISLSYLQKFTKNNKIKRFSWRFALCSTFFIHIYQKNVNIFCVGFISLLYVISSCLIQ